MENREKKRGKLGTFLRTEREKLRPMSGSERVSYLWEYYKLPILLAAFILIFIIGLVTAIVSGLSRDPQLYVYLSTGTEDACTAWFDGYEESRGYTGHELVQVSSGRAAGENASLYGAGYTFNLQYTADLTAHTIDVVLCDQETLDYLLQTETLADLSTALNGDAAQRAPDDLVWCAFDPAAAQPDDTEYTPGYFALDISDTPFGRQIDCGNGVYFTVVAIDERPEEIQAFLDYILDGN